MFCENANQFISSNFFTREFSLKSNLKRIRFLRIQSSDFSYSQKFWSIFDKTFKKFFGKMCYSRINSTNFAILGWGEINQFSYGKN